MTMFEHVAHASRRGLAAAPQHEVGNCGLRPHPEEDAQASVSKDEARNGSFAQEPFGVYFHWPFCRAKCPYCDFNSHVRHGGIDEKRFLRAYLTELDRFAELAPGRPVSSIFFGGGTPSLMRPQTVAALLEAVAATWRVAADVEITLEANPTSVEAENFAGYRAAGVNRLSLGVQALDDRSLKTLGRQHSADEALTALALAKRHFPRVSFDLIYAREGQTLAAWRAELIQALEHAGEHLSLYQLTIEPGTPFAIRHAAGSLQTPDADLAREFYLLTQELCEYAGLPAYEISNHARPGAESRHNLLYWRGHDYAGIGPGAHSRITVCSNAGCSLIPFLLPPFRGEEKAAARGDLPSPARERVGVGVTGTGRRALSAIKSPEAWVEAVETDGMRESEDEILSAAETADEYLLMSLRLSEGTDLARLEAIGGRKPSDMRIAALADDGLLVRQGERIAATTEGRLVLERLILELAA